MNLTERFFLGRDKLSFGNFAYKVHFLQLLKDSDTKGVDETTKCSAFTTP